MAILGFIGFVQSGALNLWLVLGIAVAAFSWFTNAKQYLVYQNALVVMYGRPRVKVIPYPDISHLEMLVMPTGNRLRVRLVSGKRLVVTVSDIDEFRARLDDALEKFNGSYGEQKIIEPVEQEPQDPRPY